MRVGASATAGQFTAEQTYLRLEKPCTFRCCCCCRPHMVVFDESDRKVHRKLGAIENPCDCCNFKYAVREPVATKRNAPADEELRGKVKFDIVGSRWQCAFCCPISVACCDTKGRMDVLDPKTQQKLAEITKAAGNDGCFDLLCGLSFIDIQFRKIVEPDDKALVLAAGFFLLQEYMQYQEQQK